MQTKYIDIDNGKWGIILVYNFDMTDWDKMAAIMESFGMRERNIRRSIRILSTFNSGMTVSKLPLRMSAVFIGDAISNEQWWDTISHELFHVEQSILEYYGEDWEGEPPAYLSGYLLRRVVEEIAEPCRENF